MDEAVKTECSEEPVSVPVPIPAPESSWREEYEAKRTERMGQSQGNRSLVFPEVIKVEKETTTIKKEEEFEDNENVDSPTSGLVTVAPNVVKDEVTYQDPGIVGDHLSNSQKKKLEEKELKKQSVNKLMKKVCYI